MKVAILAPLATVAPHFETELEIAQRHLEAGDRVELVACQGSLACCDFNPQRESTGCDACVGRRRAGVGLLVGSVRLSRLSEGRSNLRIPDEITASVAALKAFRVDHFDIGYAVLSSLVSICRDPQPDLKLHRALIERLVRAAHSTYLGTLNYCRRHRPDRVYVFNGRFAAARAVLRACEAAGVDCWIHERGCDIHHYQLFENRLPHDIEYMQRRMADAWRAAESTPNREEVAAAWFTDRVARIERNWHSFVKDQSLGRLPRGWSDRDRNIAVFTSSEDEFVSIGESWRNPLYPSQSAALQQIVADLERIDRRIRLYVRVHPNLKNLANAQLQAVLDLSHPRVTVIPPEDPVDTYSLLRQSEKVVTFGSSVGIEGVFWGRPSILLGPCFYRGFPGVCEPRSHAEAIEMIGGQLAPPVDRSGALKYGYWFQTHGERFRHFEATGFFEGRFRGNVVYDRRRKPRWVRMAGKVKRWFRRDAA